MKEIFECWTKITKEVYKHGIPALVTHKGKRVVGDYPTLFDSKRSALFACSPDEKPVKCIVTLEIE